MKHFATRLAAPLLLALGCLMPALSQADVLSPADQDKVREVIAAQFSAFADDDADKAFSLASPGVRESVGSSGMLLAMVRGSYPMVYRPVTITYLKHPASEDGPTMQLVQLTDSEGKAWIAIFTLEKEQESWRISGCLVAENSWRAA